MRNMTIVVIIVLIIVGALAVFFLVKNISKNSTVTSTAVKVTTTPKPTTISSPSATITEMTTPTISQETQQVTTAVIKTEKGNITIKLFSDVAPKTVANFVKKAKDGYYNNLTFHRVEDWVIQGGDPLGTGTGGGSMPSELNNKPFVVGAVGVARTPADKNISNDSQFFITKKDSQFLNGDYTNFGIVTDGMDVVNKIAIGDKILGIDTQ